MGIYTIKAGNHYDSRLFSSFPHIGQTSIERVVEFLLSCRYELPEYHREDVNKLFGLSFGFFALHQNSARFGWRWSRSEECFELLAYCYVDGERNWDEQLRFPVVAKVKPHQPVRCTIYAYKNCYCFTVVDVATGTSLGCVTVPRITAPTYGLIHSLYFGGKLPAPHTMKLVMRRIRRWNAFQS